ncbi:MAG: LacI family DNA-binding transcriptional regulator [Enterococcus sp.]
MKKASMQDIADALGISKNSVSQALRNKPGVSQKTKNLVQQKADELGYEYQIINSNSGTQRILLVATEFALSQTSFFGEIIKSIENELRKEDCQLAIHPLSQNEIESLTLPPNILDYDGVIILSHSDNNYIKEILATKLPVRLVDHHDPSLLTDAILSKNTDGTLQAVSLLIENGLNRIGFIGDINFSPSYLERYRGYHRALSEHDLIYDKKIELTQIEETQGALFNKLKSIETMPDAWFCVNSGLAFMLNSYLQSAGYTIPEDISIICYDDTEFTRMAVPPITNVATDLHFMGQLAVNSLMKRITNPSAPFIHQQIIPNLNIRGSVKLRKS